MSSQNRQALLSYDADDDQPQGQLRREDFGSEQSENSSLINQTGGSMKTMTYGASGIATGAARGAMGLAQGAANLAHGAATAVRNTWGHNPESHNFHTPLPNGQPRNHRY
ncbi:hypothetical protein HanRHA438_Chr10g0461401 [Helianthus annuus]|uniref:Uncharacterized protein n=1 Tax=Helianthus annuus TaxID=4232 RepID=A0A251TL16_HELAN|nr:uncharacterized protein LOC110882622 [Helianthus annuus]KAF5787082.1 hypothetical protein HanXRQr2_Chr10g0448811 [Helianthus annuus]KAJ0522561.1 hypothetical protein HanIR_Chr10g0483951 [Helianthus annuus]KAJ0880285.1 hypothetical protein HanRHA438_Chr10g0461401 [Helianthus annuus]